MSTPENLNNENLNDPQKTIQLLKEFFDASFDAKEKQKQELQEKERIENDKKKIEEEKQLLENQKKQLEDNSNKLYEEVKTKFPKIDNLAKTFRENSDLDNGFGFLTSINALIEDGDYTTDEIVKIVKNDFTDEDFSTFKNNDDASKITKKLDKLLSKYKHSKKSDNLKAPASIKNEPEQPLRRDPASYTNSLFTPTSQIKEFYDSFKSNRE